MKKIFLSTIFSLIFITPVYGAVFDYNKLNLKSSLCAVENNDLITLQNISLQQEITKKELENVKQILSKIKETKNTCRQKISKAENIDAVFPFISKEELDACEVLGAKKEASSHYINILKFDQKELLDKGYKNKEEVEEILKIIDQEIKKFTSLCSTKRSPTDLSVPVFTDNSLSLNNYFKNEVSKIASQTNNPIVFLDNFKKLNKLINLLENDFLTNHNDFLIQELSSFISEISFANGKVFLQNQEFSSSETKKFNFTLVEKNINILHQANSSELIYEKTKIILQTPLLLKQDQVFIEDANITSELSNFLNKSGNFILSKNNEEKITLNGDFIEKRKILGIFPIQISTTQNFYLINGAFVLQKEKKPWWYKITF